MPTARKPWLRRQAIQLSGQLPEDVEDAREVLKYMGEIVDTFMAPRKGPRLNVVDDAEERSPGRLAGTSG